MPEPSALARLADEYHEAWLRRHPVYATAIGERRHDSLLEDESPEGAAAWRSTLDAFEARLSDVSGEDAVTHAALREAIRTDRAFVDADLESFTVDPMDGPQVGLLNIPSFQPVRSAAEGAALLERWSAMPAYLDTASENLRRGVDAGRVGVAMLMTKVLEQIDDLLARADADWPLLAPAESAPDLRDRLLRLVGDEIRSAFAGTVTRSRSSPRGLVRTSGRDWCT